MQKVILSKKYGVDLVRFTHTNNAVICASKNGWDGMCNKKGKEGDAEKYRRRRRSETKTERRINIFYLESLRYLSLYDNRYLRYFKGHRDR